MYRHIIWIKTLLIKYWTKQMCIKYNAEVFCKYLVGLFEMRLVAFVKTKYICVATIWVKQIFAKIHVHKKVVFLKIKNCLNSLVFGVMKKHEWQQILWQKWQ